jgi:acetylglutamate kinase
MTVVIKFGGNAMVDSDAMTAFISGVKQLSESGANRCDSWRTQIFRRQGCWHYFRFKGGYRVTTAESVQVVRDVLVNKVNKNSLIDECQQVLQSNARDVMDCLPNTNSSSMGSNIGLLAK